jgi:glycosyltransferase involved in cell wall biosynthesis
VKVLVWPTYSYAGNVGADSLYLIARNLIDAARTDLFQWTLIVPDLPSVPVDVLDDRPDVRKVRVPMSVLYRQQEAVADPAIVWKYAPQDGTDPHDVLLSMSPARSLNVSNAWSIRTPETARAGIVNWDLLVRDDGSGEMTADDVELLQQAAGAAAADSNVFESPIAKRMTLDMARKHLSPSNVLKVIESSSVVLQGIPADEVYQVAKRTQKREKFAVYYGGRFSTSKRLNELAEVIDAFYRFGRDVEFVVTTGSLDGNKRARFEERFPQVELHIGLSQEDAWKVMASCHASICFSTHELFGMAFWEQMAAGLAVVMKAEKWNKDLLPPGYEYAVGSSLEAAVMLRGLHREWVETGCVHADVDTNMEGEWETAAAWWVRENYDSRANMVGLLGEIERVGYSLQEDAAKRYESGSRRELVTLVKGVLDADDNEDEPLPFSTLIDQIRNESRVGKNVVGCKMKWAKSHATLDVLRIARWLGWDDATVGGEPVLMRRSR